MFSDISNRYKSNINRGLMFGDISNRYKSNKDNARFRNLNFNNKDKSKNSNLNNSILNLGASDNRGNHNTRSLKENLI